MEQIKIERGGKREKERERERERESLTALDICNSDLILSSFIRFCRSMDYILGDLSGLLSLPRPI